MGIDAVYFDLGDTLMVNPDYFGSMAAVLDEILPAECSIDELARVWRARGLKMQRESMRGAFAPLRAIQRATFRQIVDHFDLSFSPERFEHHVQTIWDFYIRTLVNAPLYADVPEALDRLEDAGYILGLISDADREAIGDALARHRLDERFDTVVLSSDVGRYKPARELFETALDAVDVAPDAAVYVGDAAVDIIGANGVGMHSILIDRNGRSPEGVEVEPDFTIETLAALERVLEAIGEKHLKAQ